MLSETEVITYIEGNPYGLNLNYQPPEDSCLFCFHYNLEKASCGTVILPYKGRTKRFSRYAICQQDGPKAFWRPALGRDVEAIWTRQRKKQLS